MGLHTRALEGMGPHTRALEGMRLHIQMTKVWRQWGLSLLPIGRLTWY